MHFHFTHDIGLVDMLELYHWPRVRFGCNRRGCDGNDFWLSFEYGGHLLFLLSDAARDGAAPDWFLLIDAGPTAGDRRRRHLHHLLALLQILALKSGLYLTCSRS